MKTIPNFENYAITEDGAVFSYKRKIWLKPRTDKDGYLRVNLYDGKGKLTTYHIHRLVAETYIPNPNNLPLIDHIDRDRQNNSISNLRWVSHSQNLRNTSRTRCVINLDTGEIFDSIAAAAETVQERFKNLGSARSGVRACCNKRTTASGGYRWAYYETHGREED